MPDGMDYRGVIDNLNRAFTEYKAENDAKLADLAKGQADVVRTEKVDRINAAIGELQAQLDAAHAKIAAGLVGSGGEGRVDPLKAKHKAAFEAWFRKGVGENELGSLQAQVYASATSTSAPDGGYVIPEEMEAGITRVLAITSVMRQLARVVTLSGNEYERLISQGGAGYGWVGETGARPETTTPTLSKLSFPVMELYANPAATQRLLDDGAISIEQWIAEEVQTSFTEGEGAAFISGNGVAKPFGLTAYATVADASYVWGKIGYIASGAASTMPNADKLMDLIYALKTGYQPGATLLMNRKTTAVIRQYKSGDGIYLWQPPLQLGQPASIFGVGIAVDDNMPDIGAGTFPVAYGNFPRAYVIVDRLGTQVLRDPYTNKPYVHFYTTRRVGGGVQNFEAVKLLKVAAS
jgi:HK97 family phage major capsid protein